jgi:hypothetical protein
MTQLRCSHRSFNLLLCTPIFYFSMASLRLRMEGDGTTLQEATGGMMEPFTLRQAATA